LKFQNADRERSDPRKGEDDRGTGEEKTVEEKRSAGEEEHISHSSAPPLLFSSSIP
jgi:hypothetical protein